MCLKGNLSPTGALRKGTPEDCLREARECLAIGSEGGRFIFSVADNLAPGTPEKNIAAVAELLHG
jgi:uroporphyrinogen-III decarboxylase